MSQEPEEPDEVDEEQNGHKKEKELPEELVDPSTVVDDQSQLMFAWKNRMDDGDETDPIELVGDWLPGDDEHHGKTNISINQARPIALLLQMEHLFPNIIGDGAYMGIIESIGDYEQLLTSIPEKHGTSQARKQQVKVLSNMPGTRKENRTINVGSSDDDE